MRLVCVMEAGGLTLGKEYVGQLIIDDKGLKKIIVYNDDGRWRDYSVSKFKPT